MSSAFEITYESLHSLSPPNHERGSSRAPVFSKTSGFLRGFDLTLQLQVGCPGGCLFCYVPSNPWFTSARARGKSGRLWGYRFYEKEAIEEQLREATDSGALADKTIYWSGVTDPYAARPPITKSLWEILNAAPTEQRPRRLVIQTRFRPDRDRKAIANYEASSASSDGGPAVVVSYSVGTDRDDVIRAWEKSTPSFPQRMDCISRLRELDLTVIPTLSPFALWNDLDGTLDQFKDLGVPYLTVLFFKNLGRNARSANTPSLFLQYLNREYPELLDPRWQREQLERLKKRFGPDSVIEGHPGFETLMRPQEVDGARRSRIRIDRSSCQGAVSDS